MDELEPPPPPPLIRRDAVVLDNTVTINDIPYDIRNVEGIDFIIINGELYNLKTDDNRRYIMMADGSNQLVNGGRRRKSKRSRKLKRSRRV